MVGFVFFIAALWFLLCAWQWKTFAPWLPFFIPSYLVQVKIFGIPFTLLEVLVLVTFAVWVMRWVASREEFHFVSRRLRWWFGIFFLAGTIGLVAAPSSLVMLDGTVFLSSQIALGIWKGWVVMGILAGFLFAVLFRDAVLRTRALYAWFGGGFFVSLWALAQVWSGVFLTPDGRASGPFLSANYLSLYIAPMVVAAFGIAVETHRHRERAALLTVAVMMTAALFFSKSYAAWLAVAAAGVLYAVLRFVFLAGGRPKWRLLGWSSGGFLAAIGVFFWLEMGSEKLQSFFEFTERSSSSVRLEVWQIALQLIAENPLAGIGLGQFPAFYQLHAVRILGHVPYEWVMLHPHNIFFATWLFAGLLGFLWLVWVSGAVFVAGYSALRVHTVRLPLRRMIVLFVCVFLTMFLHGFFDTPLWKNDLMVHFWFIVVFLFSIK